MVKALLQLLCASLMALLGYWPEEPFVEGLAGEGEEDDDEPAP